MNGQRIPPQNELQKGCPDIIPGLRSKPWWLITFYLGMQMNFLG